MTAARLPQVVIYTKPDCCLCDEAKGIIKKIQGDVEFTFQEVNIAEDPDLVKAYGEQLPLIFIDGVKAFKFRVEESVFRKRLKRAKERGS